mmetsp:Transcript_17981/g.50304  ORF Transcript_17981/g.50304 Transcript_17981/m.50304 type:complete len:268 (+) Transcript_17981:1141-1944(+)
MYKALALLGHMYLMKDISMLHEALTEFGLQQIVRLYEATKQEVASGGNSSKKCTRSQSLVSSRQAAQQMRRVESARSANPSSAHQTVRDMATRHSQEMVRRMVVDIMKELEASAYEYFSYNWDRMHSLARLNAMAMMEAGALHPSTALHEALQKGPVRILHHGRLSCPNFMGNTSSSSSLESLASSPGMHHSSTVEHLLPSDDWRARARANWERGRQAAAKKITMDMLGQTRKSKTLKEVFGALKVRPWPPCDDRGLCRLPVGCVLG